MPVMMATYTNRPFPEDLEGGTPVVYAAGTPALSIVPEQTAGGNPSVMLRFRPARHCDGAAEFSSIEEPIVVEFGWEMVNFMAAALKSYYPELAEMPVAELAEVAESHREGEDGERPGAEEGEDGDGQA